MHSYRKNLYGHILWLDDQLNKVKNNNRPYVVLKDEFGVVVDCYPISTKDGNDQYPNIKAYPHLNPNSRVLTAPEFKRELERSIALLKASSQKMIDKNNKIKQDYLNRHKQKE